MPIKNILVALSPRPDTDRGRDFAISMAKALKAHICGRIYGLEPDVAVDAFGGLPADLLQAYRGTLRKEAQAAIIRFETAAAKAKLDATAHLAMAPLATASSSFAQLGRTYDVSVLTQSAEGISHMGDVFAEAALFQSGRPVIVVPREEPAKFATDVVVIAWDGGLHAARAVGASMPILERAKKIEILTVGEKAKDPETYVANLVENLQRHGMDAVHKRRGGDDVAKTILKEATKASASMLIMGAYGHSRLREFVFGGATRYMLQKATLPVLMMH